MCRNCGTIIHKGVICMIGDKLKARMAELNMSPAQLEKASGVPVSTIYTYLQNRADPIGSRLKKIADAVGRTADWFLSDPTVDLSDPKLKSMFDKAHELTEEEKQSVVNFISFVREQRKEKKVKGGAK